MKILRIRLRNLASLAGTHSVDFTSEPLASAGLFAISGPTGSGKSTLLDALCLALYEHTPRLSSARGEALPDAKDGVQPKDPANLLRRGTAEGFAEVAFVGLDGQTYTARWSVRRARQRVEGALQKAEMALYRGNVVEGVGGELLQGGRKTEVLTAIKEKIGLNFEQFTRAVLLAQNEFAGFLKADDKERALILQALTGSHRFERLSVAAFERERKEQQAIRDIEARMQGQVPLAPDLRTAAEQACELADQTVAEARRAVDVRVGQVGWFERLRELETAVVDARSRHEAALHNVATSAPRRTELERATEVLQSAQSIHLSEQEFLRQQAEGVRNQAAAQQRQDQARTAAESATQTATEARTQLIEVRAQRDAAAPILDQARTLDAELLPATERLKSAQEERRRADTRLKGATECSQALAAELTALRQTIDSLEGQRAADRHLDPCVPEATGWFERLGTALRARAHRNSAHTRCGQSAQSLQRLTEQIEVLRPAVAAARDGLARCTQEHSALVVALQGFDPGSLARERQELDTTLNVLGEARTHLGTAQALGLQIDTQARELSRLQALIAEETRALTDLEQRQLPIAEATWITARDLLANAQAAVEHAAETLRAGLRPSQPCPVCGALDHPYAAHAPVADAALESLRGAAERHRKSFEDLRTESIRLGTLVKEHTAALESTNTSLSQLQQRRSSARTLAFNNPIIAVWSSLTEAEATHSIEARTTDLTQRRNELAQREEQHRKAAAEAEAARVRVEATRQKAEAEERKLAELERSRAAAAAAQDADRATAEQATSADDAAIAALAPLLDLLEDADKSALPVDPVPVFTRLQGRLRQLAEVASTLQQTRQRQESAQARFDAEARELQLARDAAAQSQAVEQSASIAHTTLLARRQALLGGRSIDEESRRLDTLLTTAEKAVTVAAEAETESAKAFADATGAVRAAVEMLAVANQRAAAATEAYEAWLAAFAARTGLDVGRAYIAEVLARGETWFAREREALAVLTQAVNTTLGECTARIAARDEHLGRRPTEDTEPTVLEDLAQRRTELQKAEDQLAKAKADLLHDDQRRAQSADLLEQLNHQRAEAAPWEQLNALIGSADGAKFRAIAQRHTLDLLLLDANAQLELIAARYRLERLPESLNLIVVDRDMGDERRGVHSLSGGESFLVSLALALGLASLTSSRIRIESLFIDEGFGSLDPETLNTAMGALMHLEAQGRKVGVISHVTEMADAIPVQIRVVRGRNGASRLVVPGQESARL
jgi:DNA repair protein SbcC/Rad50